MVLNTSGEKVMTTDQQVSGQNINQLLMPKAICNFTSHV